MNPKGVIEFARANDAAMVDLKFVDLLGKWQHTTVPVNRLNEASFEDGFGFDSSSIRGFQPINLNDMLLIPDPRSGVMDPFTRHPTLSLQCTVQDPITHQAYTRDPRYIATKAEAYLRSLGIADECLVGPEAEFFIFDSVHFELGANHSHCFVDSSEAAWNSGVAAGPNLGHKIRSGEGYAPCRPQDSLMDLRTEICLLMAQAGLTVERQHHEVGSSGQGEIDMSYDRLLPMADKLMWFKYIVRNAAHRAGKTATFMPKPVAGEHGNGMHVHQSLWKDGKPIFAGEQYAGLSEVALYYIGGILKHARAISALTNPTLNSYKRLVPGFEAPVNLAYSSRNRSAAIRMATFSAAPGSRRIEVRFPDPTCNPYIAFSALLMAGIDGIQNKIDPGDPLERDIYSLTPEELADVPQMPESLEVALEALEDDHDFLLKGDVFTQDVIESWVDFKREHEIAPSRIHPTPFEYHMYFDA